MIQNFYDQHRKEKIILLSFSISVNNLQLNCHKRISSNLKIKNHLHLLFTKSIQEVSKMAYKKYIKCSH